MPFSYTVKNGDTINSIANRYGFKNYKDAGISSVPSGNFDLIKEGESISLGNYDPNKVQTFSQTSPVVSSLDNKAEFMQNSDKISGIDRAFSGIYGGTETKVDTTKTTTDPNGNKTTTTTDASTETSGDPVYDALLKQNKEQEAKLALDAEAKKEDYASLYQTSLANLDATTQATIDRITSSYDKRIKEQQRINQLNIDRTKAYGLANGGQYTPIDFGDAVSLRETEASDKINALEGERTSLINQAKVARDNGASALLRQKLADLDKVDADIRTQLKAVEDEGDKRYKMLRDIRTAEETKAKERREKALAQIASLAPSYSEEYEKMTPEQKNSFIQQIVTKTGLDYASIYGTLEAGMVKSTKDKLDIQGKVLENSKKSADIASAWKKVNEPEGESTKVTPAMMSADAPESFSSDADFKKQMTSFVRKYGSTGATYWDKVYQKDSVGDYSYTTAKAPVSKAPVKETKSTVPDTVTKIINGKTVTLKKGTDGKYYPQ